MVLETIGLLKDLETHYMNGGWWPGVHDDGCGRGCLVGQGSRLEVGQVHSTDTLSRDMQHAPATAEAMIALSQDPEVVTFWKKYGAECKLPNRLRRAEYYNDHLMLKENLTYQEAKAKILALIRRTIARLEEFKVPNPYLVQTGPRILTETPQEPPTPEETETDGEDQPETEPTEGIAVPV